MSDDVSSHTRLVRQIEEIIHSLGYITFKRGGVFAEGFLPDIVTNVGGTNDDWVVIDIINTQESLVRDVGGLLVVKTNAEREGKKIRWVIGVVGSNFENASAVSALLEHHPQFIFIKPNDFEIFFNQVIVESLKDKAQKFDVNFDLLKQPENLAKKTVQIEKRLTYDAENIKWEPREGPKGLFQIAIVQENIDNSDFAVLQTSLKEAQSPVYGKNHLYWLMQDGESIGRKEKVRKDE